MQSGEAVTLQPVRPLKEIEKEAVVEMRLVNCMPYTAFVWNGQLCTQYVQAVTHPIPAVYQSCLPQDSETKSEPD